MKIINHSSRLILFLAISGTTAFAQSTDKQTNFNSLNKKSTMQVVFIDHFIVPAASNAEFVERMNINRDFIKNLNGFIEDAAYEQIEPDGNYKYVTVAIWENDAAFKKAKEAVAEEYKRQNFDPAALMKRLNIQLERGVFTKMGE